MNQEGSPQFTTETTYFLSAAVLKCKGELDVSTEAEFAKALETMLRRDPSYVCLDLRDLDFVDMSILRTLKAVDESARERDIRLEMLPGPAVQRLLEVLESTPGVAQRGSWPLR